MLKILAISKLSATKLRFLCLKSTTGIHKARAIVGNIPYPCFDIDSVIHLVNPNEVYFADYDLKENNLPNCFCFCSNHPRVTVNTKEINTFNKCLDAIYFYCPSIFSNSLLSLGNGFSIVHEHKRNRPEWVFYNNVPLFLWKPYNNSISCLASNIQFIENGLVYVKEQNTYFLTEGNVRHKPFTLGERLTIILSSMEITRVVQSIDSSDYYSIRFQYFDRVLREWVTIKSSEPLLVLGKKGG